jgi:hypothetical protein
MPVAEMALAAGEAWLDLARRQIRVGLSRSENQLHRDWARIAMQLVTGSRC